MRSSKKSFSLALVLLASCAESGPTDTGQADSGPSYFSEAGSQGNSPTAIADAGGSKDPGTFTPDAGDPLGELFGGLGGLGGGTSDASAPMSNPDGGGDNHCENRFCFDVFDCYIINPDGFDCGWTSCVLFTCQ